MQTLEIASTAFLAACLASIGLGMFLGRRLKDRTPPQSKFADWDVELFSYQYGTTVCCPNGHPTWITWERYAHPVNLTCTRCHQELLK
jgi:hypothetical protein